MTYRDRQRLRSAQARRPAPQKWPETMAELTSLPTSATASGVSDPAAVRARLVQNTQQALKALQATQSERTRLAAQRAGDLRSRQQLLNAPYLSLTGRGPLQISTPPAAQRSLFNVNQDSIPSPEPGPPPDYGQQMPEPSPTPQPHQAPNTSGSPRYGMIDPGVAIAQQIMEKRNKDLQDWAQTAAIASALGLPVPPVPPMPGGQVGKPSGGQSATSISPTGSHGIYGWTEWDVPVLDKWKHYKTDDQKFKYLFGQDWANTQIYKNQEEAQKHMKTITVKVWTLTDSGEKVASTKKLTVNEKIADMVCSIFTEIFNDPEQFPINVNETGGFNWRYGGQTASGSFSEHSHGIALDINYGDNPYYLNGDYMAGDQQTGRSYEPGICPYAITEDSSIVKIFKKYGWTWGGDFKTNKDYMHFQWYGNGIRNNR